MLDNQLTTSKSIIELHRDLDAAVAEVEAARAKVWRIQKTIDMKCRNGMGQIMAGPLSTPQEGEKP